MTEYEIGWDDLVDGTTLYQVFRAGTRILEAEFITLEGAREYVNTLRKAGSDEDQ